MAKAVVIDTSVFIYWLEGNNDFGPYALKIMEKIESGELQGFASELVIGELLVRPLRLGLNEVVEKYSQDLPEFPNLEFVAIDRNIVIEAARMRAEYNVGFADALHMATASVLETVLISNDQRLIKTGLPTVAMLDYIQT